MDVRERAVPGPARRCAASGSEIEWTGECTAAVDVSDYGKALAWYRDVLGFEVVFELETWGWAQLQTPVDGLLLGIGQSEEVKQGGGATVTFTVEDIGATRAYLEGEGVPSTATRTRSTTWSSSAPSTTPTATR